MVGTARFELATPCTPSKCATRLRYVPTESAVEGDSVGFDLQILHQAAATGEEACSPSMRNSLSQTSGDGYHHAATASRGNMIAWQYLVP